jgi:hypothetical protein
MTAAPRPQIARSHRAAPPAPQEERGPLAAVVTATFPAVLAILQGVLANPSAGAAVGLTPAHYAKLALKAFWSATFMGIPDALLEDGQFRGWMAALHELLRRPLPMVRACLCVLLRVCVRVWVCVGVWVWVSVWRGAEGWSCAFSGWGHAAWGQRQGADNSWRGASAAAPQPRSRQAPLVLTARAARPSPLRAQLSPRHCLQRSPRR